MAGKTNKAGSESDPENNTGTENGTVVPVKQATAERVAVTFLGPHHRYSRGDIACFDQAHAEALVERNIAVWPEKAEAALTPGKDDGEHDTDIG